MQELGETHAGADPDLGASVLLNSLIFAHIWGLLDVDDKRQLRAVGRGVRALADGLVVSVTMNGKPATELGSALAQWPDLQRLTADGDVHSAAVISAAPLSKLRALVLEYKAGEIAACMGGSARHAWVLPAPCMQELRWGGASFQPLPRLARTPCLARVE
ncbi:hypothetical protein FOA52_013704 [Chlamydomonas sp. UWO 241]|nr:hypothetical protein FOA52_013704 [Chlamydomonas sp. UWO 241]